MVNSLGKDFGCSSVAHGPDCAPRLRRVLMVQWI